MVKDATPRRESLGIFGATRPVWDSKRREQDFYVILLMNADALKMLTDPNSNSAEKRAARLG